MKLCQSRVSGTRWGTSVRRMTARALRLSKRETRSNRCKQSKTTVATVCCCIWQFSSWFNKSRKSYSTMSMTREERKMQLMSSKLCSLIPRKPVCFTPFFFDMRWRAAWSVWSSANSFVVNTFKIYFYCHCMSSNDRNTSWIHYVFIVIGAVQSRRLRIRSSDLAAVRKNAA